MLETGVFGVDMQAIAGVLSSNTIIDSRYSAPHLYSDVHSPVNLRSLVNVLI